MAAVQVTEGGESTPVRQLPKLSRAKVCEPGKSLSDSCWQRTDWQGPGYRYMGTCKFVCTVYLDRDQLPIQYGRVASYSPKTVSAHCRNW